MDISEYTQDTGSYLKAEDIAKNQNASWEITAEGTFVKNEKFNVLRLHLPIKNGNEQKIFDCSKTNARVIENFTGKTNTKDWIGKKITFELYKTRTTEGKLIDAINVKLVK